MVIAVIVGAALVAFIFVKSKNMKREDLEQEADEAREQLIPDAAT